MDIDGGHFCLCFRGYVGEWKLRCKHVMTKEIGAVLRLFLLLRCLKERFYG